jgi:hypothetical protein
MWETLANVAQVSNVALGILFDRVIPFEEIFSFRSVTFVWMYIRFKLLLGKVKKNEAKHILLIFKKTKE